MQKTHQTNVQLSCGLAIARKPASILAARFSHTSISIYLEILLYMYAYLFQRVSNDVSLNTLFFGAIEKHAFPEKYVDRCVSMVQTQYSWGFPAIRSHAGKLDTSGDKRVSIGLPSTLDRMSDENLP